MSIPPSIHPMRLKNARGQTWITESDLEAAGYVGYLGEVVQAPPLGGKGTTTYYELAALMSPSRVGITTTQERVWWLLPMSHVLTDSDLETAVATSERG